MTGSTSGGSYYVVSGHRSTAVSHCLTGNFTSSADINLIVAKFSHFEVYFVTPEGLKLAKDVPLYGRLTCVEAFRPAGETKDYLFIMTKKYDVAILDFVLQSPSGENNYNVCSDFEIVTRAHGNVMDRVGKACENGMKAIIDPLCRCIALRLYDGSIKVIPLTPELNEITAFILRCEEVNIVDLTFLHGCEKSPTICLIYQTHSGRHAKTYEVDLVTKELTRGPWKQDNIEIESSMVVSVPTPVFGVLIIAAQSITYHQGEHYSPIAPPIIKQSLLTVCSPIDSHRFLMGDMSGRLFLLILEDSDLGADKPKVRGLNIVYVGQTTISECITYLDNGFVFVGSKLGDSQVIKLNDTLTDSCTSHLSILETITNLGPIVDLAVVHCENQGPDQIVTCSGMGKEGSLRIIRNGIGIQEMASIDLFGIKGVWSLKLDSSPPNFYHNVLVLSFVGQTRMLRLSGEEVEEFDIVGFSCDLPTLFAGNVAFNQILQVTSHFVKLVDDKQGAMITEWRPSQTNTISKVACNGHQIVVATGRKVFYLVIKDRLVCQVGKEYEMPYEVACIDVTSVTDSAMSDIAAFGLWTDITARLFLLPGEERSEFVEIESCLQKLGGEIIPRSCMLCKLDGLPYLLYALGDGSLVYFKLDYLNRVLSERRKVNLGTQPMTLTAFETNSGTTKNVFACSDRPTVIYSLSKKLLFSNVNLKQVTHMCSLNAEAYENCLVLCNDSTLTIGSMDQIQKLHIRNVPLYETPLAMSFQKETQTYAVLTMREDFGKWGADFGMDATNCVSLTALSHSGYSEDRHGTDFSQSATPIDAVMNEDTGGGAVTGCGAANPNSCMMEANTGNSSTSRGFSGGHATSGTTAETETELSDITEVSSVIIIDQHTYEPLHSFRLNPNERGWSVISANLEDDAWYYIVGTTYVYSHQAEPDKGRLIVLQWNENKLNVITEKEIKGCPYSIQLFNGKILAGINHMVELYEWAADKELRLDCSNYGNVIALHLKTKGDFVLVGDLVKSVSLLLYKPQESSFEEIARDYNPMWTTAVEILDDDTFLVGETNNNLYTVTKDSAASIEEDRRKLTLNGRFHINDLINVFRHGALAMNNPNESVASYQPSVLFGTVSGSIGLIVQLPPAIYTFLQTLQDRMTKKINSVGLISHANWRSFNSEFCLEQSTNFIDGDVIELFLDMTVRDREDLVKGLKFPKLKPKSGGSNGFTDSTQNDLSTGLDADIADIEDNSLNMPGTPGGTAIDPATSANSTEKICVDDVVKLIEDLARLH